MPSYALIKSPAEKKVLSSSSILMTEYDGKQQANVLQVILNGDLYPYEMKTMQSHERTLRIYLEGKFLRGVLQVLHVMLCLKYQSDGLIQQSLSQHD